MRISRSLPMLALLLPLIAFAADIPKDLEPLPEAPPPPAGMEGENPEPEVTITKKGADTIEEYRINGELYMMKVTPATGVPYYLTKDDQNAGWARSEGVGAPISIPKWVLFRF
ncbi:DUF2782 domain-containing protein [Methylobacillus glycogenes]|uniref:DUF2782 domain-containing protein n=1 Tax=Methylobacillus glycogenes TaxID=406 RepID=UPI0005607802|nr:DUF2782 domain-containing protein [Methylobacillus glycogenes]